MTKNKKLILLFLTIIMIVASITFRITIKEKNRVRSFERFQDEAKEVSLQFDRDLLNSNSSYEFLNDYNLGANGSLVVVDSKAVVLFHPIEDLVGENVPIPEITEMVEASLNQQNKDEKDLFFTYVFNDSEKMVYLHNVNDQEILLIVALIDSYESMLSRE